MFIIIQVGISTPSTQDIEVTKKLEEAAKILGIELLDHIVIGNSEYTSIKTIEKWKEKFDPYPTKLETKRKE